MEIVPYLVPGAATMAVLGMVYLLLVYWVRRPGRQAEVETNLLEDIIDA